MTHPSPPSLQRWWCAWRLAFIIQSFVLGRIKRRVQHRGVGEGAGRSVAYLRDGCFLRGGLNPERKLMDKDLCSMHAEKTFESYGLHGQAMVKLRSGHGQAMAGHAMANIKSPSASTTVRTVVSEFV